MRCDEAASGLAYHHPQARRSAEGDCPGLGSRIRDRRSSPGNVVPPTRDGTLPHGGSLRVGIMALDARPSGLLPNLVGIAAAHPATPFADRLVLVGVRRSLAALDRDVLPARDPAPQRSRSALARPDDRPSVATSRREICPC